MASLTIFALSPAINSSASSSPSKISSVATPIVASRSRSVSFPRLPIVAANLSFRAKSNSSRISSIRCALSPELKTTLNKVITSQKIIVFMKGTRDFPECGFSKTVVQILNSYNVPYETFNILENEVIRQGLKEYSNWPTYPQLYIDGEFFGGCDITIEAYKSGELQELLEKAMCS